MTAVPRRAFLGLGSNLGDRRAHLRDAVAALPDVVAVSSVYETAPVGGPEQGPYLNCVVELRTALTGHQLLDAARACEAAAERVREVRWGPRTLDVDVLWIDGEEVAPNAAELSAAPGEALTVQVTSDRAGELHVHAKPEQFLEFDEGQTSMDLVIDTPGTVEVEDHDTSAVVAIITVG